MNRTLVLNVVGMTPALLAHAPNLAALAKQGAVRSLRTVTPAVTTTVQSTFVTGTLPREHGIVGNGWYFRDLSEIWLWRQSNRLVGGEKLWDAARRRDPSFTCAKLFWWYNMYSTADYSITPRPMYPADGRKVFDIYTSPFSIRHEIKKDLGEFPFPTFWGPAAGVKTPQGPADAASKWIAASAKWIESRYSPALSLIYLPHLDYNFQRFGPSDPRTADDVRAIDAIVGDLVRFFTERNVSVMILSEYGIADVNKPIDLNKVFRVHNWLTFKDELGREMLDCGASKVFAVADHQIAHIYINDPSLYKRVRSVVGEFLGPDNVLDSAGKAAAGIDHPRAGDLIALAPERSWFTYYYWGDPTVAPDFARCVDIHRKPGYDPVELFIDPALKFPRAKIAWRLLKKKLGFRMLMDVIPLDASLVRGSHGLRPSDPNHHPILITQASDLGAERIEATDVFHILKRHVRG